jgi:hypothetical protein
MGEKILISGGSGLVGKKLTKLLIENGYEVAILSRSKKQNEVMSYFWDYENGIIDQEAIEFSDIIIHLAGEGIANKRWTQKQKQKILESRTKTSNLLFQSVLQSENKPHTIISASAVGYYGNYVSNKIFTEEDQAGDDFISQVVVDWEKSVDEFEKIGLRTVKLRIGIVLSEKGGALQKMILPHKFGMGSALGSGKQFMPWISIDDLVNMFLFGIENRKLNGVFNAVAPEMVNNVDLMRILARSLKKPFFMPRIPAFVLKLAMGELSEIVLKGNKVSSVKILSQGFKFKHNNLSEYLPSILNR